jgi:hypothetical protein
MIAGKVRFPGPIRVDELVLVANKIWRLLLIQADAWK